MASTVNVTPSNDKESGQSNGSISDQKERLELPSVDSHRTLPAQWMTDENIFKLEMRAVFSKVWLLTSHTGHFSKPGDYVSGNNVFDYIIIRDEENTYRAFHNVCRHRAYPVVTKDSGNSSIIGCKYHGWSYNAKGDLVKAPKFDSVEGFDKSANGLYKIHIHVTPQGFIFLNFDSSPTPVPFEEHFGKLTDEWKNNDFSQYEPYFLRTIVGNFNWKLMTDGYQECYHCPVAHPGFSQILDLKRYNVEPLEHAARHSVPTKSNPDDVQCFTFVFPTNGVTVTPDIWYILRTVPLTATQTRMEYDYFRRKGLSEEVALENRKFYTEVQTEDFDLCEGVQKNINKGIYESGVLHPKEEKGVLYYQSEVLSYCKKHLEAERVAQREIYPARPSNNVKSQSHSDAYTCLGRVSRNASLCNTADGEQGGPLSW